MSPARAAGYVAVLLVGLSIFIPPWSDAAWARKTSAPARSFPSVLQSSVLEWFANPRPSAGGEDTVYARLVANGKPVVGATSTAIIKAGKHVLTVRRGTDTNKAGQSQVTFRVPTVKKGTDLQVIVRLHFQNHTVIGTNDVRVRG